LPSNHSDVVVLSGLLIRRRSKLHAIYSCSTMPNVRKRELITYWASGLPSFSFFPSSSDCLPTTLWLSLDTVLRPSLLAQMERRQLLNAKQIGEIVRHLDLLCTSTLMTQKKRLTAGRCKSDNNAYQNTVKSDSYDQSEYATAKGRYLKSSVNSFDPYILYQQIWDRVLPPD
jgi:hypothetical protein